MTPLAFADPSFLTFSSNLVDEPGAALTTLIELDVEGEANELCWIFVLLEDCCSWKTTTSKITLPLILKGTIIVRDVDSKGVSLFVVCDFDLLSVFDPFIPFIDCKTSEALLLLLPITEEVVFSSLIGITLLNVRDLELLFFSCSNLKKCNLSEPLYSLPTCALDRTFIGK